MLIVMGYFMLIEGGLEQSIFSCTKFLQKMQSSAKEGKKEISNVKELERDPKALTAPRVMA